MKSDLPQGCRVEVLAKAHNRAAFDSGVSEVNDWLKTKARQTQEKNLSITRLLLDANNAILGYYTLANGHVRLDQLPHELARKLPNQLVPVVVLAWLGVDRGFQGRGIGEQLLAHALKRCHEAAQLVPFAAVVLDCLNETAKAFYVRYDFREMTGHPMKLLISRELLDSMASAH